MPSRRWVGLVGLSLVASCGTGEGAHQESKKNWALVVASESVIPCDARDAAIVANSGSVILNANTTVDSYDSSVAPYGGDNVGDQAVVLAATSITQNGGTVSGTLEDESAAGFDGIAVPDVAANLPLGAESPGNLVVGGTLTLAPGQYVVQELTVQAQGTLKVEPDGPVQIWVTGNMNLAGDVNEGGAPANLTVIAAGASSVNVNSGAAIHGSIYAPLGNVNVNGSVFGGVVGKSVTLNSGGSVHYDVDSACYKAAPPPEELMADNWTVTDSVGVPIEEVTTPPTDPVPMWGYAGVVEPSYAPNIGAAGSFMLLDYANKTLHAVSAERLESAGLRLGEAGVALQEDGTPMEVFEAWSNATDDRVSMTIADGFPLNHRLAGRIGKVQSSIGHGTGTLVGRRLVITAAHVILDGQTWAQPEYIARADPSNTGAPPYGSVQAQYALFGGKWISNNCHNDTSLPPPTDELCVNEDWAILVLPPWQGAAPAYAGYAYDPSEAAMQTWDVNHAGYPGCITAADALLSIDPSVPTEQRRPDAPILVADGGLCDHDVLLGQASCSIGRFMYPLSGEDATIGTSCDTSPGHSGGSVMSDDPGSNGPYIVGLLTTHHCIQCGADGNEPGLPADVVAFPTIGPRINGFIAETIQELRGETQ